MGCYIETPQSRGRARYLIEHEGAREVTEHDRPGADELLVCVVENGPFDAAGIAYSENERLVFAHPDGRPRTWLLIDRERGMALCKARSALQSELLFEERAKARFAAEDSRRWEDVTPIVRHEYRALVGAQV